MNVQVITRDGEPEYAVLPWADYQTLLQAAGHTPLAAAEPQADQRSAVPFSRLSELREKQGMSLEELGRSVGISPSYLELIERGVREPDTAIRRSLARVLGVAGWEASS
ncbi:MULTISPECIES: helix-turn-helix domain-containing protein [Pseudomonas]|jgi:DNA-binding XRE family transcriptional regulator|uniref:Helix-turn-helix transcriptional regulator n=1 Tax=Serpens gallinarum TaxID=2763075 RepID=A0ABR8TTC8_9PSED|nr:MULTISPECIES: helix-turn-helix transcriptional regulator [Pseudomonas]MBD7978859.1 helix-turn-helix transcriptional regulator [Serpens gallinarum]MBF0673757.1 helix-turn-helix transcriptional regulator [Pseudomonas sp.]